MNFDQKVFFNQSFRNSMDDTRELIRRLLDTLHKENLSHILFTVESTSLYFFHIANLLLMDEELK